MSYTPSVNFYQEKNEGGNGMKRVFFMIFISYSITTLAQTGEGESLFPELDDFASASNTISTAETEKTPSDTEQTDPEDDLFAEKTDSSAHMPSKEDTIEETDQDDQGQYIYIALDDIKATLTPNSNASFCSAAFIVANGLKREIISFTGTFTVGSMTKEFKFDHIEKEQAAGSKYTFVGNSCAEILNPPAYTIQNCQVEGWSEEKCKKKVAFVAIPKEEAE